MDKAVQRIAPLDTAAALAYHNAEMTAMQKRIDELQAEHARLEEYSRDVDAVRAEVDSAEGVHAATVRELKDRLASLVRENEGLAATWASLDADNSRLQQEVAALTAAEATTAGAPR